MRTTPVVFVAVIVALVTLGLFVANYAYAGQVSLLPTFAVSGVSVVPAYFGGAHAGWYGRGYYGGWGPRYYGRWWPGYYVNPPSYGGTYQNGNKTCVWNGYKWRCYLNPALYVN